MFILVRLELLESKFLIEWGDVVANEEAEEEDDDEERVDEDDIESKGVVRYLLS